MTFGQRIIARLKNIKEDVLPPVNSEWKPVPTSSRLPTHPFRATRPSYKGGSLHLWRDYFERGLIVGLDLQAIKLEDPTGRIRIYEGMQQDRELLDRIARETAPQGFDPE